MGGVAPGAYVAVTAGTGLVGIPRVMLSRGGTPAHVANGGGPVGFTDVAEDVELLVVEVEETAGGGVLFAVLLLEVELDETTTGDGELETDDTEAGGGDPLVESRTPPGVACLLA